MAFELRHVRGEALAIVRRYPAAALAPAAALGAGADLLHVVEGDALRVIALALLLAMAYDQYIAYMERLVVEAERGADTVSMLALFRSAAPIMPAVFVASVPAVTLPL